MAIKTMNLSEVPTFRDGRPVKGPDDEDMALIDVLVKALEEVDFRVQDPRTGQRVGAEKAGDIMKRITLAEKLAEHDREEPIQLEGQEFELLQKCVAGFCQQPVLGVVMRALKNAEVKTN